MAQSIVNAKLMADVALEFNIGADLLSKANRSIDKYLGAEKKSGDTVWVPITDAGEVFRDMNLSNENLEVDRDEVPVTVRPLDTAASVSQDELTLSINNPEIMSKRVANLADTANHDVYETLVGSSQAFVANVGTATGADKNEIIREAAFDAQANTEASKFSGDTFGVTHPFTWNRINAILTANFGANDKRGNDLYRNELGDFMGFTWSKASQSPRVVGSADAIPSALGTTLVSGAAFAGTGPTVGMYGETLLANGGTVTTTSKKTGPHLSQPFTIAGVYNADALGHNTGNLKTFQLQCWISKVTGTSTYQQSAWYWAVPPVFEYGQGRLNCFVPGITDTFGAAADIATPVATAVLTAAKAYMAPAVIYKKDDLLVAVKGLEKFYGCDSFTIPTSFREKGVMPLRGTAWTDPIKAATIFRVDVLMGSSMYTGLSASSIWLPM